MASWSGLQDSLLPKMKLCTTVCVGINKVDWPFNQGRSQTGKGVHCIYKLVVQIQDANLASSKTELGLGLDPEKCWSFW